MKGLRSIVPISREQLRGIEPSVELGDEPTFEWVDPRTLYVEESYQRGSDHENSLGLVRKIVARFAWSRFKTPICARQEDGTLLVIDGQHTAISAATHPKVKKIPVMIVGGHTVDARAGSFVGHNTDRLVLTNLAIYRGQVVAGNEESVAIDAAVRSAGALILAKHTSTREKLPVGVTTAVGTIRAVFRRNGPEHLTRVLKVLVDAGRAPILGEEIAATSLCLGRVDQTKLVATIASKTALEWRSTATVRRGETGEKPAPALAAAWHVAVGGGVVPRPAPRVPPLSPAAAKFATPKPVEPEVEEPDDEIATPAKVRKPGRFQNSSSWSGGRGPIDVPSALDRRATERRESQDLLAEAAANTAKLQEAQKKARGE